jgi:hypothetical protein
MCHITKEQLVKILNDVRVVVANKATCESAIRIQYGVDNFLWELDCCIKNVKQVAKLQKSIACLLDDTYDVLETPEYEYVKAKIKQLRHTTTIDDIAIKEMCGTDCSQIFEEMGFNVEKYSMTYEP